MSNFKEAFTDYINDTNVAGSGKAKSYVRALDLLSKMLQEKPFSFTDCINLWSVVSVDRLHELYLFVLNEAKKGDSSPWNITGTPVSYLQNSYCSAALKSYQEFLVEHVYQQQLLTVFNEHEGDEPEVVEKLDRDINYPKFLLDGLDKKEGKEVIRSVRVRVNQHVFRLMMLKIYDTSCCITGLNIRELNMASHIIPWADDEGKNIRLDPSNGLCLSATYDAAFDKKLISLDEDYRIIISKNISDHYKSDIVKEHFNSKAGDKITLPSSFLPKQEYLEKHRSAGRF
jgi:putative restriction endonuclease